MNNLIRNISKSLLLLGGDWDQVFSHYHKKGIRDCSEEDLKQILRDLKKIKKKLLEGEHNEYSRNKC